MCSFRTDSNNALSFRCWLRVGAGSEGRKRGIGDEADVRAGPAGFGSYGVSELQRVAVGGAWSVPGLAIGGAAGEAGFEREFSVMVVSDEGRGDL